MGKGNTYVTLILDKSGSMGTIRESAISMFNAQIEALLTNAIKTDQKTKLTLITFSNDYEVVEDNCNIDKVKTLKNEDYLPSGSTAMYDTIVYAIEKQLSHRLKKNDAVLFIIITDGEENSSREHQGNNGLYFVKGMIEAVEATKQWTITFMGTEDALSEAKGFNLFAGNTYSFETTNSGIVASSNVSTSSINSYYSLRSTGATSTTDFFNSEESLDDDKRD